MKRKFYIAGTALAILFAGTAATACYLHFRTPRLPDPAVQKPEEIAKTIASDSFVKLPPKVKDKYLENLANHDKAREIFYSSRDMSDAEKQNLRDNMRSMFETAMTKKAKEYFALPPDKREAFLDNELDKMNERRMNRPGNPGQGGPGFVPGQGPGGNTAQGQRGQGRRQPPTVQAIKKRIETTDPADRAMATQYRTALRARAQQRTSK